MHTFIGALLMAGISATTFVAFKHPNGYARLFPYLLAAATTVFLGITLWHVAIEVSWRSLDPYLVALSKADAESAIDRLRPPLLWAGFWYLGLVAFLWVNLRLPTFLQVADQRSTTEQQGNSHRTPPAGSGQR